MKKNLLFLLTTFLLALSFNANAQSLKTYTWKSLGISFLAPSDLEVSMNNKENFESASDIMVIGLRNESESGAYSSINDLEVSAKLTAAEIEFSFNDAISKETLTINDFNAVVLKSTVDGDDAVLAVLATEDFKTVITLMMLYDAASSENIVNQVINSFKLN